MKIQFPFNFTKEEHLHESYCEVTIRPLKLRLNGYLNTEPLVLAFIDSNGTIETELKPYLINIAEEGTKVELNIRYANQLMKGLQTQYLFK